MATSGFSSRGAFRARALLFSGRSDPEWLVGAERAAVLAALLDAAPSTEDDAPVAPALGYRGVRLSSDDGDVSWVAYGGIIIEQGLGRPTRRLHDADRRLERAVLASAPAGALPLPFLEGLLGPVRGG